MKDNQIIQDFLSRINFDSGNADKVLALEYAKNISDYTKIFYYQLALQDHTDFNNHKKIIAAALAIVAHMTLNTLETEEVNI